MRPGGCGPGQHRGLSSRATKAPLLLEPSRLTHPGGPARGQGGLQRHSSPIPYIAATCPQEPLAHPRRRGAHLHLRLPIPHLHSFA